MTDLDPSWWACSCTWGDMAHLCNHNGEWFTRAGTCLHPDCLALHADVTGVTA